MPFGLDARGCRAVYILYLDESGDEHNPNDRHFVLAGAAIFERVTYFLSRDLDALQARYFPGGPPVDFHAAPIRSGKDRWRRVTKEARHHLLADVGATIARAVPQGLFLFGAVVEKAPAITGDDAVKRATEEVAQRFDRLLTRFSQQSPSDPQRGLLVFAEGRFHKRARVWVQGFRELGTQWGVINNLSDIPYFAAANETRLLQIADYVAYALFRLYEHQDPTLLQPIVRRFDRDASRLHGIVHVGRSSMCACPPCHYRRHPGEYGPWI
jgi:hypothetical protein